MTRRSTIAMSTAVALVAGCLAISPVLRAKGNLRENSALAAMLMSDARAKAATLQKDVNLLMVNYARARRTLDEATLAAIQQHVTDAQDLVAKIDSSVADFEPWQRDVMGDIGPILKELAGNTNSALRFLDNPGSMLHETEFDEYLVESDNLAKLAAAHIASSVDFGIARDKFYDSYGRFLNALMEEIG